MAIMYAQVCVPGLLLNNLQPMPRVQCGLCVRNVEFEFALGPHRSGDPVFGLSSAHETEKAPFLAMVVDLRLCLFGGFRPDFQISRLASKFINGDVIWVLLSNTQMYATSLAVY